MYCGIGQAKILISITYLKWRYVEDYDFYDVELQLDGFSKKRIQIDNRKLVNMKMPDAVAQLLKARIDCVPIRGVEKPLDKR